MTRLWTALGAAFALLVSVSYIPPKQIPGLIMWALDALDKWAKGWG